MLVGMSSGWKFFPCVIDAPGQGVSQTFRDLGFEVSGFSNLLFCGDVILFFKFTFTLLLQ